MNCLQKVQYTIRRGDNLYQLSRYFQTTVQEILALNPGIDPYNLQIGRSIIICPANSLSHKHSLQIPLPAPTLPCSSTSLAICVKRGYSTYTGHACYSSALRTGWRIKALLRPASLRIRRISQLYSQTSILRLPQVLSNSF